MQNFMYHTPTKVIFGKDTVDTVGEEVKKCGTGRALIVYGSERIRESGLLAKVEKSLGRAGIAHEAFGGVKANPTLAHAEEGVKRAIERASPTEQPMQGAACGIYGQGRSRWKSH